MMPDVSLHLWLERSRCASQWLKYTIGTTIKVVQESAVRGETRTKKAGVYRKYTTSMSKTIQSPATVAMIYGEGKFFQSKSNFYKNLEDIDRLMYGRVPLHPRVGHGNDIEEY
jgi:hypothetical protein